MDRVRTVDDGDLRDWDCNIDERVHTIGSWAEGQFPESTDDSRIAHLRREVGELADALHGTGDIAEEWADCFMILCHIAHARGLVVPSFAVARKFAVAKARRYGAPDAEGVVEHLRGDE